MESLFNEMASLKAGNFIKKRLQHLWIPVNIAIFLKNAYFEEQLQSAAFVPNKLLSVSDDFQIPL